VTSNLYTFCGFQYKRVPHHGSLHRERFSRFQISTEVYLGGICNQNTLAKFHYMIQFIDMQIFVFGLPSPLMTFVCYTISKENNSFVCLF
jgi:hypothetical protein